MSKITTFNLKNNFINFSFVLPAVVIFSIFYIYPFFEMFNLSFREWDGIGIDRSFIGLRNYTELLFSDKEWWHSMWNAAYITIIALTFQNALAFALALACDREIRMKRFYRVVFFIPPVLSEVVVGLIWRSILATGTQDGAQIGLFNAFLDQIGLHHLINSWLSDPDTALTCLAVVHSWKGFGWGFIMLLAGLQTIDRQLYEAAKVDGAGSWHTFWHVTIPMMVPVILVVVILTILGSMQVFVLILSMVGDGIEQTQVPVLRILGRMNSGDDNAFGYACTMGVIFGLILIGISFFFKTISDKAKQV